MCGRLSAACPLPRTRFVALCCHRRRDPCRRGQLLRRAGGNGHLPAVAPTARKEKPNKTTHFYTHMRVTNVDTSVDATRTFARRGVHPAHTYHVLSAHLGRQTVAASHPDQLCDSLAHFISVHGVAHSFFMFSLDLFPLSLSNSCSFLSSRSCSLFSHYHLS